MNWYFPPLSPRAASRAEWRLLELLRFSWKHAAARVANALSPVQGVSVRLTLVACAGGAVLVGFAVAGFQFCNRNPSPMAQHVNLTVPNLDVDLPAGGARFAYVTVKGACLADSPPNMIGLCFVISQRHGHPREIFGNVSYFSLVQ